MGYPTTQNDTEAIIEALRKATDPNWFTYYFNHPQVAVDTDFWTSAGDSGGFTIDIASGEPPSRKLYADTAGGNDWYIHADAKYAKLWSLVADSYRRVTFRTRLKMNTTADTQAMWGLFEAFPTGYSEPAVDCAEFFIDDGVDAANFVCRSYDNAAEEQTSGSAFDTSYHDFEFVWSETSVIFTIDDAVVAIHSTRIPAFPIGIVFLIRTEAAAEKSMDIEYVEVSVE